MDKINFTGGFLLRKPTPRMWEKVYNDIIPKNKRIIINDIYEPSNVFIATKGCVDRDILKYLLNKKTLKFTYYPNVSTKNRFDSYFPKETELILDKELAVSDRKSILKYSKPEIKPVPEILQKYKWKENDHIPQTMKALRLDAKEHTIVTKKNITRIYNKAGVLIAKVSPNTHSGINYAYIYPRYSDENLIMAAIDHRGNYIAKTSNIDFMETFNSKFINAVKIDAGRTRSTRKA